MSHLLRIHIGPVQEFIAAARRSRDLWYGSWLLSELSKAAAQGIVGVEPAGLHALIFPAPADPAALQPNSPLNVANEIVAVIEGAPAAVAQAAHDALQARLAALIDETFTVLRPLLTAAATWPVAEAQLAEFVEFYWVAVPLGDSYPAARAQADRLLAARKNSRSFGPAPQPRPWPKSSLDGARETVIPQADRQATPQVLYERYGARPGEQLSGVDLLKRLGRAGDESRFPSTSHMAAMPLRHKLDQVKDSTAAREAWQDYLETLPPAAKEQERADHGLRLPLLDEYDGSLLFASRLVDYLEREPLRRAEAALRRFYQAAGIEETIVPYYALLAGDGDFMGETISTLETIGVNQQFSRALAGFAAQARDIVKAHDGAVIFAGGDDVLALLPLPTAVACAAALATAFAGAAAEAYGQANKPPTLSVGLAIVHHLEPLEDALTLARAAEKTAKRLPDGRKNALAVALDKRSGVPRLVTGHWGALDRRLLAFAALHQAGDIPDRLAYQILDSYHLLGGAAALRQQGAALRQVLALEALRLIDRKHESGGGAMLAAAPRETIRRAITNDAIDVAALADELVIAAQMAKANKPTPNPYLFQPQQEVAVV